MLVFIQTDLVFVIFYAYRNDVMRSTYCVHYEYRDPQTRSIVIVFFVPIKYHTCTKLAIKRATVIIYFLVVYTPVPIWLWRQIFFENVLFYTTRKPIRVQCVHWNPLKKIVYWCSAIASGGSKTVKKSNVFIWAFVIYHSCCSLA